MRLDPDDLAAAATRRAGDPDLHPDDTEDRRTLAAFDRIVGVGRSMTAADVDDLLGSQADPPSDLWDRIAASLDTGTTGSADVVDLSARRRAWRVLAAVAAVAVLVAGIAGVVVSSTEPGGTELASAQLELLAGSGSGQAQLVERTDGVHLVVDVADLAPAEQADFYELWLLTPDGTDPQSIHKIPADRTTGVVDVLLPPGVDTTQFPVVDISEELSDGDDTHSGKSILRGTLTT